MFPPKTRILVVDDMGPLRAIVKEQLKDLGFTDILEASDGHRAIDVLKTEFLKGQPVELMIGHDFFVEGRGSMWSLQFHESGRSRRCAGAQS